ncbi:biotin/lipoyl-binding protein [Guyparkeria sp. SCN-R1]|uniref:efflux RND transporter periplasmic adaptor subunit n=1 Tax=Guyparkeria sp. SCN-R1 TaxID=2341113 RepID=UPI000F64702F|nr:efflux RND transporter periplasmic adaptor subunit [Guyparkeria sp. SCN-R1]RRQ24129.1 biotin/lipoyl-binding protein [Guyparkeria sp. SCN-R1]
MSVLQQLDGRKLLCGLFVLALTNLPPAVLAHGDSGAFAEGEEHHHDEPEAPVEETDVGQLPSSTDDGGQWPVVEVASSLIGTVLVENRAPQARVPAYARVVPRPGAVRDINAYLSGQVSEVHVRPGMRVEKGDLIASIYSPEFILTQRSYLALLENEELKETLREEGRLPNYKRDARSNLRWWGMAEDDILALEARKDAVEHLDVRAEVSGVISEVFVAPGEIVRAGDRAMESFVVVGSPLARIVVDGGGRRLQGSVYADTLATLNDETRVRVRADDGEMHDLALTQSVPAVDSTNRLGRFLVDLENPNVLDVGRLVGLELLTRGEEGGWLPRDAVMGQGTGPIAFVEVSEGRYERRTLTIRDYLGGWSLADAVSAGERVVTRGKTLLEGAYRLGDGAGLDDHHDH